MLQQMRKFKPVLALTVLAFAGFVNRADAALQLSLDTGSGSALITDEGVGDFCPQVGCITMIGAVGGWSFNITTGTSKPVIGPAALSLNSVDVAGVAGGVLTIRLTDTDFIAPAPTGPGLVLTQRLVGLNLPGGATISAAGYQSNTNALFDTTGATSGSAFIGGGNPFASASGAALTAIAPYSLTEIAQITFGQAGIVQFSADLAFNPEPTALVLVGSLLFVMVRRLRKHAVQA